MSGSGRRGFALMTALMVTLIVTVLALTAASLALLARRTAGSALVMARADAMAETIPPPFSIPPVAGTSLVLAGPRTLPGWSLDWTITRLGGDLLLIRSDVSRLGAAGDELAHASLGRLYRCCDSLPPTPLSGGWLGTP